MLNGVADPPVSHARDLRQRDTILSILFFIATDLLKQILNLATSHGLFHKIRGPIAILRTSLYVEDGPIFVAPIKKDIKNLAWVLI